MLSGVETELGCGEASLTFGRGAAAGVKDARVPPEVCCAACRDQWKSACLRLWPIHPYWNSDLLYRNSEVFPLSWVSPMAVAPIFTALIPPPAVGCLADPRKSYQHFSLTLHTHCTAEDNCTCVSLSQAFLSRNQFILSVCTEHCINGARGCIVVKRNDVRGHVLVSNNSYCWAAFDSGWSPNLA